MKKLFILLLTALLMSCADSKTFEKADGTKFVAELYEPVSYVEPNITK